MFLPITCTSTGEHKLVRGNKTVLLIIYTTWLSFFKNTQLAIQKQCLLS